MIWINCVWIGFEFIAKDENTYLPKISEDLIPVLYRIRKEEGIPMTKIVDKLLRESLDQYTYAEKNYDPKELENFNV